MANAGFQRNFSSVYIVTLYLTNIETNFKQLKEGERARVLQLQEYSVRNASHALHACSEVSQSVS